MTTVTARVRPPLALILALAAVVGCRRGASTSTSDAGPGDDASANTSATSTPTDTQPATAHPNDPTAPSFDPSKPLLGVTAFVATVYAEPRDTSRKLGYLRVGAIVPRSPEPAGKSGCSGGWYGVEPHGYVCVGEDATIDLDNPILKAAARRPNLKTALPYHYAFVRAVLPLYLRVPTAQEQYASEFKLKEHLDWYAANEGDVTKVLLGANDVPLDERGVAIPEKKIGELGLGKNSTEIGIGALLGGDSDADPIPSWLEGGKRAVPNISDFKVPEYAVFADRARRHTGLSLIASFPTGPDSLNRRFAVTTDLRLAPATKIKPDTGSPWHGVELDQNLTLPLAFIRAQGARAYKIMKGKVVPSGDLDHRSVVGLTGKMRTIEGVKYYRTRDKTWVHQLDVGLAVPPATWPEDAEKGKKWIEISIGNQTLVLWEGKRPVYATLISSGQAGLDDPKKTTATIRGTFSIRNKHITATMDSNESSSVGGKANTTAVSMGPVEESGDDKNEPKSEGKKDPASAPRPKAKSAAKDSKGAQGGSKAAQKAPAAGAAKAKSPAPAAAKPKPPAAKGGAGGPRDRAAPAAAAPKDGHHPIVPKKGDGVYGVTKRRGEGTFQLRDVPYIQYFESGYALHAAYWHDVFGTPRSHGCVNLSPIDAHRIFFWTDPPMPDGWHAINTGEEMGEGTTVIIHE